MEQAGGGEIISHRLAGAAALLAVSAPAPAHGAGPQLIIPSCLHLPAASAYEQWAEPRPTAVASGRPQGPLIGPDWMLCGCKPQQEVTTRRGFARHVTPFSFSFLFFSPQSHECGCQCVSRVRFTVVMPALIKTMTVKSASSR